MNDQITYEIHEDLSIARFYIKAGFPYCYVTDKMTKNNIMIVAQSMRSLGYTVIDRSISR
jgi:hypothetical protein